MERDANAEKRRAQLSERLDGVPGWLQLPEAWELHETARRAGERRPSATIVEIGSWKGRSAIALATGLVEGGAGRVFAIDPHVHGDDRFRELVANLETAGVSDVVEPMRTTSHLARARFPAASVDVLFVDGSHEYRHVSQDIDDWRTALADGATAAFNDPFWPGVNRALRERVVTVGSPFRRPRFVSNTILFDHAPHDPWTAADALDLVRSRAFLAAGRSLPHPSNAGRRARGPVALRRWEATMSARLLVALLPNRRRRPRLFPGPGVEGVARFFLDAFRAGDEQALRELVTDDIRFILRSGTGDVDVGGPAAVEGIVDLARAAFRRPFADEVWAVWPTEKRRLASGFFSGTREDGTRSDFAVCLLVAGGRIEAVSCIVAGDPAGRPERPWVPSSSGPA